MKSYLKAWPLLVLLLSACASLDTPPQTDSPTLACHRLFEQVDAQIAQAGLRDEGDHPIAGFPYLRSNRLLAALAERADEGERLTSWLSHLAALDTTARRLELRRYQQAIAGLEGDALDERLNHCRKQLLSELRHDPARLAQLRQASQVDDDYLFAWRVAGLYPLTAPIFTLGIKNWHRQTRASYALPLAEWPQQGRLHRWASPAQTTPAPDEIRHWLHADRDPLGIPQLDRAQQGALFARFAPIWEVDVVDDNDRIGGIRWQQGAYVDRARPTEYRLLSHTLLEGEVLTQLNYLVWFPARPGNDIYAGWLDGLFWRVTLDTDGRPLLYDSIHPCGCYHLFFPTPALRLRQDLPRWYYEQPLQPQQAPAAERLVIRVSSARHYIERVYPAIETRPAIPLLVLPYDELRALPDGDGWHSLFGHHGLVAGSERFERFLFWPMGIRSPGAMRQWGRHPTAFVGRRHFDTPDLIEALFERVEP